MKVLKLRPPVVPENALHSAVARALDVLVRPPAVWTTFPAGSVPLPPQFAAKLARMGLQRGWPDLLVIHNGRVFGIELKRAGGGLSRTRTVRTKSGAVRVLDGQDVVFPRLEAAGMQIGVCRSVAEVIDQLAAWGVPMVAARVPA